MLTPARRGVLAGAFEDLRTRLRADGGEESPGGGLPFDWLMLQCDASQLPPVLLSAEAKAAMTAAQGGASLPVTKREIKSAVPNELAKGGGAQALSLLVGSCERMAGLAGSVPGQRGGGTGAGGSGSGEAVSLADFSEMHEGISMEEEDDGAFSLRVGLVWRVDSLATMPGSVAAAGPRGKAAAQATTSLAVLAVLQSGERVMVETRPGPFFRRGDRATERLLVEGALRRMGKPADQL